MLRRLVPPIAAVLFLIPTLAAADAPDKYSPGIAFTSAMVQQIPAAQCPDARAWAIRLGDLRESATPSDAMAARKAFLSCANALAKMNGMADARGQEIWLAANADLMAARMFAPDEARGLYGEAIKLAQIILGAKNGTTDTTTSTMTRDRVQVAVVGRDPGARSGALDFVTDAARLLDAARSERDALPGGASPAASASPAAQ